VTDSPDAELVDHDGRSRSIASFFAPSKTDRFLGVAHGYPVIIVMIRGPFCPGDQAQLRALVAAQHELGLNGCEAGSPHTSNNAAKNTGTLISDDGESINEARSKRRPLVTKTTGMTTQRRPDTHVSARSMSRRQPGQHPDRRPRGHRDDASAHRLPDHLLSLTDEPVMNSESIVRRRFLGLTAAGAAVTAAGCSWFAQAGPDPH